MASYRQRLIAAREALGLTPREMAARLLTPRQTYEQWERDQRRTPGVAVVAAERYAQHAAKADRDWPTILASALTHGLTLTQLARHLGVTPGAVSRQMKKHHVHLRSGRGDHLRNRPRASGDAGAGA